MMSEACVCGSRIQPGAPVLAEPQLILQEDQEMELRGRAEEGEEETFRVGERGMWKEKGEGGAQKMGGMEGKGTGRLVQAALGKTDAPIQRWRSKILHLVRAAEKPAAEGGE